MDSYTVENYVALVGEIGEDAVRQLLGDSAAMSAFVDQVVQIRSDRESGPVETATLAPSETAAQPDAETAVVADLSRLNVVEFLAELHLHPNRLEEGLAAEQARRGGPRQTITEFFAALAELATAEA